MPINFDAGGEITGASMPDVEVNGGVLYINDSQIGDITVNAGNLVMSNSQSTDVLVNSANGSSAYILGSSVQSLTATGGSASQELIVSGLRIFDGGILSVSSTWRKCDVTGVNMGRNTTNGSGIRYTDVENFRLAATCLRTGEEGAIFEDCLVGEIDLFILNPGAQTDNTYAGIQLNGACDQLNFYGSVRGAVDVANNPIYGFNAAAGTVSADVWMVFAGWQTAATNDASGNVVFH